MSDAAAVTPFRDMGRLQQRAVKAELLEQGIKGPSGALWRTEFLCTGVTVAVVLFLFLWDPPHRAIGWWLAAVIGTWLVAPPDPPPTDPA